MINLKGKRVGRLRVLRRSIRLSDRWWCLCKCGLLVLVTTGHLTHKEVRSCGCLKKDMLRKNFTIHGMSKSKTYQIWSGMLGRCYRKSHSGYKNYGARGIRVCKKWFKFKNFLQDMGECPKGKSIERIDNDGNYELENCKWATRYEQVRNTRRNRWITVRGVRKVLKDWANSLGIDQAILRNKLNLRNFKK